MSDNSSIQWTTSTFNPWWGCTKVSAGCAHCYAKHQVDDRRLHEDVSHWGPGAPRMRQSDAYWDQPLRWDRRARRQRRPLLVFAGSMCDVFDEEAPRDAQERLWEVIDATPHLRWQLLTKRPERILESIPDSWRQRAPANVWFGTSVENADYTWRVHELVKVPAKVRFLSVEPLLGPLPRLTLSGVHWVIVGGESGPRARPMRVEWVRQIRDRCKTRGIPFLFKQWGAWNEWGRRVGKARAGRRLDGLEWNEFPGTRGA